MIGDDKNPWSYGSSLHFLFTRVNGYAQYQENVFDVPLVSLPGHIHVSMDGLRQQTGRSFLKVSIFGFLGKKRRRTCGMESAFNFTFVAQHRESQVTANHFNFVGKW